MRELDDVKFNSTRRHFLSKTSLGIGALGLASLLDSRLLSGETGGAGPADSAGPLLRAPHFVPRAKRVIYLFQSGGPSQLELFDHKPLLRQMNGQELPASIRMGQRLTGMTAFQRSFPVAGSQFEFARHGKSGMWVSELLPHTAKIVDELCVIKSLHTEAINHDPAVKFFQTGSQHAGRPSIGAWLSYGIGSDNSNLPAFIVLLSRAREGDQPLYSWLWGSGFLPSQHQGVQFRGGKDPVLYLSDPKGISRTTRRRMLDTRGSLEEHEHARVMDPEINARVSQYEMAFRMQTAVPDAMGLLDDTLVLWGGEFGRTNYSQGKLTKDDYGRDHHPRCFTMWMAGAGVKKGFSYGETDEFGYNVARDPVHVHDLQATLLHLLGVDHEKLLFKHQGRRYRLTDVHGHVVKDLLA